MHRATLIAVVPTICVLLVGCFTEETESEPPFYCERVPGKMSCITTTDRLLLSKPIADRGRCRCAMQIEGFTNSDGSPRNGLWVDGTRTMISRFSEEFEVHCWHPDNSANCHLDMMELELDTNLGVYTVSWDRPKALGLGKVVRVEK